MPRRYRLAVSVELFQELRLLTLVQDRVHPELLPVLEAASTHVTQVVERARVGTHVVGQVGDDEVRLVALLTPEPTAV